MRVPGYKTVCVKVQHVFVGTLDVAVDTQHKHLCSWIYSSCLCINNFNLQIHSLIYLSSQSIRAKFFTEIFKFLLYDYKSTILSI